MKRLFYILSFLSVVLLVQAAASGIIPDQQRPTEKKEGISDTIPQDTLPVRQRMQARRSRNSQRRNYTNPMDSIRQAIAERALRDSLPDMETLMEPADSLTLDSLMADSLEERGLILPVDSLPSDTVQKKKDGPTGQNI